MGAIVARRLQNNSRKGNLFGGLYATRVANYLGIAPQEGDMIIPPVYLDKEAMFMSRLGMAILSMDLDTHGYPTRLGKGMEHIFAHGSMDMDTHKQPGWAWL